MPETTIPSISISFATSADAAALARLAALDSSPTPTGAVLVARVDGELWAARSLDDGRAVSDPFRPATQARELLVRRSRQLHAERRPRARLARRPRRVASA